MQYGIRHSLAETFLLRCCLARVAALAGGVALLALAFAAPVWAQAAAPARNPVIELPGLPEDAEVFVNGSLKGRGVTRVELILPANYHVMVRRKGFRPWTTSVLLGDGQTVRLQPEFKPLRLAIFPIRRTGVWAGESERETSDWVTAALDFAARQAGFAVSHSVHVNRGQWESAGEDLRKVPGLVKDAWGLGGANLDLAATQGQKLDVDGVVFFQISPISNITANWNVQVVDPKTRAVTEESDSVSLGRGQLAEVTRKVRPVLERFAASLVRSTGKQTVAVLELEAENAEPGAVYAIGEALRAEMRKTGRFTVLEGAEQADILDRVAPNRLVCTAVECALEAGRLFGVQKVVAGRVTGVSDNVWKVAAIQVDVATGETLAFESVFHKGDLAKAGRSVAPLAQELAVAASPEGATFRSDQAKWRWKAGLLTGGAVVAALAGAYLVAEVSASNDRQKDDRIQAEQATTLAEYEKWIKKLEDEKAKGETLRNQAIVAQVAFVGLAYWAWRSYRNPPELTPVAWRMEPVPARDGRIALALSYTW